MTPEARAALRALREKATAGEWRLRYPSNGGVCIVRGPAGTRHEETQQIAPEGDGEVAVAAVNALVPLLDALDAAEARVAALEAEITAVIDTIPGAVRVREGGGPEDLAASLAVSVSKLRHDQQADAERAAYWERQHGIAVGSAGAADPREREAYRRGVEAMREAAARKGNETGALLRTAAPSTAKQLHALADAIATLPVPEDDHGA